ncbi:MAG: arginase family protein [Bacteroidales bacterium]|nr:arginase family protein [Bacteroidales bacterium]
MNIFINISGVYDEESWALPEAAVLDLRHLDGCCCYCDTEAEETIRNAISGFDVCSVHWIDTGDYHYISKLWMEKIQEPFVLALFDNHPDDQEPGFGRILSCGSWVLAARESLPNMKSDYLNTAHIPDNLPVYLSIDLDVLSKQFARTGWSQGGMKPDDLLSAIGSIASGHNILGIDICGGLTAAKGARAEDFTVNARTRNILAAYFSSHPLLHG